jgi:hypothetical protein
MDSRFPHHGNLQPKNSGISGHQSQRNHSIFNELPIHPPKRCEYLTDLLRNSISQLTGLSLAPLYTGKGEKKQGKTPVSGPAEEGTASCG